MIKKLLNNATDGKEIIDVELIKPTPEQTNSQVNTDEKPIVRFGMLTLIIGFGGFLLWSAIAPLDEGVPGTGIISVDTKRKTIQHLRGGLVESIAVREGDRVKAGDVLLRLNDTDIKAQLDITRGQYAVVKATEARLLAERDGKATVTFSPALLEAAKTDRRTAEAISAQGQLFAARKSALSSELGTVDESIVGLNQQIIGLQSIEAGKKKQIDLILKEANSYRSLVEEGFVPRNKLYELERVLADLSGTRGGDLAQIARAQASINEMKLRKLQRIQDFRKEVETQMSDVQKEVGNQSDRLTALTEEFERSVIKAPTDGTVVGMEAHTVGGVIRPGDRIMDIVPEGDVLIVEAQLPVNLIDKVRVGQLANMHLQIVLSGGAQPAIEGRVAQISADRLTEPRTGNPYYSARIQITENGEAELLRHKIQAQPGMQVDVVIVTGARTVLQYLLKPLMSRVNAGMKEQ
ncbi:MAG: HlyD family type I secretion periplasmic adaptor subunit [Dechloromonas sp.]|uniref:Membrane fusion protein (MFP) family protein n=1 Tax=Candidatus Dechloromonas phosphorivorans TaxID=2899244 RepID=A0A935KC00_9RHOO|nr:HlyD family type I secretion periplasmic adaptor subunit [Candidatus Dechloromonas phosphorivorans]